MIVSNEKASAFSNLALHISRLLLFVFFPGGLFLLAAWLFIEAEILLHWLPVIAMLAPYLILFAAIILGWRFNRARIVFSVFILVLADRIFFHFAPDGGVASGDYKAVYNAVCVLVPLNLLFFYLLKEKGFLSIHSLWRLILVLLQPPFVDFLRKTQPFINNLLSKSYVSWQFLQSLSIPQTGLILFLFTLLLYLFMFFKREGNSEHGYIWATLAALTALFSGRPGSATTIYFSVAALALVVALVEDAYCMAFRDELTKLPARRALNEALMQLPAQYTIAMLDIDFFKKFNDKHGHEVGDQVLCMVAAKLANVGGGGKAFRYGGEEFTILFPGKSAKEAKTHLEELRELIEDTKFYVRNPQRPRLKPKMQQASSAQPGKKLSITISIGIAESKKNKDTAQGVLKAADKALYRAKNKGRNQVSM